MSVFQARRFPIRTALSGPAAGVVGATYSAKLSTQENVITLDMGGTSADVALIRNYRADVSFNRSIEDFPVRLPMIDINSVGAGGGSVAWFDRDGLMKVGPESAGSVPGPACYSRGGELPTVSDANLILGRLSEKGLLGGKMPLDLGAAKAAMTPVADRLGFSLERTSHGVISIVTANMVRAIRGISVERGLDPREFSLLSFGGAGPVQAADVARGLRMKEVIVPYAPGILCAQGLVVADQSESFVRTVRISLNQSSAYEEITNHLSELTKEGDKWLMSEAIPPGASCFAEVSCDMRYKGQNYELSVPILIDDGKNEIDVAVMIQDFSNSHIQNYGYSNADDPVEVINIRRIVKIQFERPEGIVYQGQLSKNKTRASRPIFFEYDVSVNSKIYLRDELTTGDVIEGPAVIEQLDATTLIFPGDCALVDDVLNLVIKLRP